jgi:hypothetical protein
MDFSTAYGPPESPNENYVHSWLQDTVEAHQLLLDYIVCFAMSDFGGTHAAFRLMITSAVYAAMGSCSAPSPEISADRTLLLQIGPFVQQFTESWAFLRTYKRSINRIVLSAIFPSLRRLGGLMYRPSGELDAELAHYASSFTPTLAPGGRRGGGPGEGCTRMPVGTYLYLHAVGAGNPIAVPCLAR